MHELAADLTSGLFSRRRGRREGRTEGSQRRTRVDLRSARSITHQQSDVKEASIIAHASLACALKKSSRAAKLLTRFCGACTIRGRISFISGPSVL